MGDLLSAASLLLTVVAILYSVWAKAIDDARNMPVAAHAEDNRLAYETVTRIFRRQAVPLAVFAIVLSLVFLPVTVDVLRNSVRVFLTGKLSAGQYDVVSMTLVLVNLSQAILAGHLLSLVISLRNHKIKLESSRRAEKKS
jgi:hypothetical protein